MGETHMDGLGEEITPGKLSDWSWTRKCHLVL